MIERFIRKTIPQGRENHGPVSNIPDVPDSGKRTLFKLGTVICGRIPLCDERFQMERTVLRPGSNNPSTWGYEITPVSRQPLRMVFQVSYGGGRVYGGGISTEALRRAKRKAKINASR